MVLVPTYCNMVWWIESVEVLLFDEIVLDFSRVYEISWIFYDFKIQFMGASIEGEVGMSGYRFEWWKGVKKIVVFSGGASRDVVVPPAALVS